MHISQDEVCQCPEAKPPTAWTTPRGLIMLEGEPVLVFPDPRFMNTRFVMGVPVDLIRKAVSLAMVI